MSETFYAITGATGQIGSKLVRELLSKGQRVRAIGRNPEKLKRLGDSGAQPFIGSLDNADAMTEAFQGATAAFVMIPPNLAAPDVRAYYNTISESLATAIRRATVTHVVSLSSLGAHRSERMGPVNGLYDHEQRFNRLPGIHVLHLRPTFFMENTLMSIGVIRNMGINGTPIEPRLPFPMIATRDIAAEAANRLVARDFEGKSAHELLGQRDVTMEEVTRILGRAIGKEDLRYMQFPYEETQKAMVQMGMSPSIAAAFIEMYKSLNEGLFRPTEPRSAQTSTPTSIEEFAKDFAAAYNSVRN